MKKILVMTITILLFANMYPMVVIADTISGPADTKWYYYDGAKGTLALSDGYPWTLAVANIDASGIGGNKVFQFIINDAGAGWETIGIQVHMDFYGAGGHLLQLFDVLPQTGWAWIVRKSHGFNPGDVPSTFDLRMVVKDLGTNYEIKPQFRLPDGNWTTFFDGAYQTIDFELTNSRLGMQNDGGASGTVSFDQPTALRMKTITLGTIALSGGFQSGHFPHVWDLTAGDLVIYFTYDATGLEDDLGGSAHAWAELGIREVGQSDFNPGGGGGGAGVWLATDYDWNVDTFNGTADDNGNTVLNKDELDLDDKLILQKVGGHGESDYDLPSTPPVPGNNHRFWFDRDGVDQWQAQHPLAVDGGTYNTNGTYEISITLHAKNETHGHAHMTINGLSQGFETDGNLSTMELSPAGMTFTGNMSCMQVFYGIYGNGATHSVSFNAINVTGTLVNPKLVYVDDDFTTVTPGWGYDHFAVIQNGIDAVAASGAVHIYDGTYHEALHINKSLTLKAASAPIIEGSQLFTTDYGNREAVIFVEDAENVIMEGLDIEGDGLGPGPTKSYGVLYQSASGAIHDCTVSPNTVGDMYSVGVAAISGSNLLLNNSLIENFGRIGVYATNVEKIDIYNNEIIGQVYSADNQVNYGIEIEDYDGPSTAEIVGNEIYNSDNTNASVLWSSAAIIVDIWRAWYDLTPSNVSIEYNEIYDNYLAIEVVSNPLLHAHYNNIYDNRYGVYVDPDLYNNNETFDARFNWWGDASGPFHNDTNLMGLGTDVGDYVTYSPWFGFSTGTTPMTYHVNPTGKIQDAIDDANTGDTIKVYEGTYTEQLIIDKTLTLLGDPGPKIVAPDTRSTYTIPESSRTFDPIVFAYGGTESGGAISGSGTISVTFTGFEIDGGNKAVSSTYVGILYRNVNPGTIADNSLHNLYDLDEEGNGPETVGILIYGDSYATVDSNHVSEFSRLGIGANGDMGLQPDPTVTIHNNTVIGNGLEPTTGWWAENGIQLGFDAAGSITDNHVSDCVVNNPSWASSGILPMAAGGSIVIQGNTVEDCDVGINLQDSASYLVADGNTVTGSTYDGITIWNYWYSFAHNITVSNNDISNNPVGIGIYDSSNNTLKNNIIEHNDYGIYIDGNSNYTTILANSITDNNIDGIHIGPYGGFDPSGTQIHCNTITGNGATGVNKTGTELVDATWNWWGSETGPYHSVTNPSGLGDEVTDNVVYDPWKTYPDLKVEPPTVYAGMVNKTFSVNVTIEDLHENWQVVGVEFRISYNSTLLELVNVTEGSFMQDPEWNLHGTFLILQQDELGEVTVGIVILPNASGSWMQFPHGSGTLATLTFKTLYQETGIELPPLSCNISLLRTMLVDPESVRIQHAITQHCEYRMYPTNKADVTGDYYVGIDDITRCAEAFGSSPTIHPDRWNPACDMNDDDYIGIDDIVIVAEQFGWAPTYDP